MASTKWWGVMAGADQNTPGDGDPWGAPPPSPSPSGDPVPGGPDAAEAKVWDGDTWDAGTDQNATVVYEGRRRAPAPPARLTIVIGLAIVALVVAIAVPLLLSGGPDEPSPVALATNSDFREFVNTTTGRPTTATIPSAAPRTTTTAAKPPPPRPPFTAISLEAEAGGSAVTLGGSAHSVPYPRASGGRVVFNVGNWGMGRSGTVTFRNISIPTTAAYVLTLHYVHPDGDRSRSATVAVSGVSPVTLSFTGDDDCCDTRALRVTIPAGVHTVTFGNATGEAPALDKLTITRP